MTISTTITDLPEVPATNDPDFETKAPALLNAMKNTFIGEVNNVSDEMNATATDVNSDATDAEAAKVAAEAAAAAAGIAVNFQGEWSSGTTYAKDELIIYLGIKYYSKQGSNLNQNPVTQTAYWGLFSNMVVMNEATFRANQYEAKKRRGGSGFDEFVALSGENVNIGLKADSTALTISASKINVNGYNINLLEEAISFPDAPTDENARQDFLGLEVYEELIDTKDFAFVNGSLRNQESLMSGVATVTASFTDADDYCKYGNWDTSGTIGKGVVWSTLTEAQRQEIVSDPLNNIFLNEDGQYVQVRYRVRVIQGLTSNGAEWVNLLPNKNADSPVFGIALYSDLSANCIKPKGKNTSISSDLAENTANTTGYYIGVGNAFNTDDQKKEIGCFSALSVNSVSGEYDSVSAYKGNCFMLPIAMACRNRNQGGYHPDYNPMGTKQYSDSKPWNTTAVSITSTADCLNAANLLTVSGYISSGVSGDPYGFYYDEINELDVHDLRLPTNYNKNVDTELADTIKAERRGYEAEFSLDYIDKSGTLDAEDYVADPIGSYTRLTFTGEDVFGAGTGVVGSISYLDPDFKGFVKGNTQHYQTIAFYYNGADTFVYLHPRHGDVRGDFTLTTSYSSSVSLRTDRFQNNTQQRCEILGDPSNYTFSSHVGVANLVDVNDGTSNLPDGVKTSFLMASKFNGAVYAYKNGVAMTFTTDFTVSYTANTFDFVVAPISTDVVEIFTIGYSNNFVPSVNEEVEDKLFSIPFLTSSDKTTEAVATISNLLNKIGVKNASPYVEFKTVKDFLLIEDRFYSDSNFTFTHQDVSLGTPTGASAKFFLYQTNKDGLLYNCLVFKEMIFDVDWGDDQKFDIADNIVTTTDDNSNVIIYGTVIDQNPVGFAKD